MHHVLPGGHRGDAVEGEIHRGDLLEDLGLFEFFFFERRFFFFVGVARADGKRKKATTLSLARASARFPPLLFVLSLALVTRDSPAARSSSWDSKIFRKRRTKEKENGEERGKVSVENAWESIELFAFSFSFFRLCTLLIARRCCRERRQKRDKDRQGEWKGEQLAGRRQKERDVFFSSREPKGGGFKIDLQRDVMLRVFDGREGGFRARLA